MDTRVLFALKQGSRSLENHIREFLACAHYSDLPDIILIDIFCDGINQPLQTQLRREGPRSSLSCFLEFALLAHYSLWVSRMRIATPHLVTKWPPILSLRTVLPSQNLLSPGLPSRSSRPGWLPCPRMHLFGQD